MIRKPVDLSTVVPNFSDFVAALQQDLRARDSWKDLVDGSTGETLIEHNAAIGTFLQQSLETAFKECFTDTASRDSSIYAITRMLGIRVSRKLPGVQSCNIQRSNMLNLPISNSLVIPEFSQFTVGDDIPFYNRSTLNFVESSATLNNVLLYQGKIYTKKYVSSGEPFQRIIIQSSSPMSISDIDIIVYVGDEKWTVVYDGLWNYGIDDKVVADSTLGTGDVILQFGNGYNGALPATNQDITVQYVETYGAKLSMIGSGANVQLNNQLNGYSISGNIIRLPDVTQIFTTLGGLSLTLSSLTNPTPVVYLPSGNSWDITNVGFQLEESNGGLALITGVNGNEATLSVVSPFTTKNLSAGSWFMSVPTTGQDEKPSYYYKVLSPNMSKAMGRAVTTQDHSAVIMQYSGISDVLVRTEKDIIKALTQKIQKSAEVIAREQSLNIYNGVDYYEIVPDIHPALQNVIWVSFLTSSGLSFNSLQNTEFLNWFRSKQFDGTTIKLQVPTKNMVDLSISLYCNSGKDLLVAQSLAETAIRKMFATDKPMLSKKIVMNDIYDTLSNSLDDFLDYSSIEAKLDGVATFELVPKNAAIDDFGFPVPPGYLYLQNLSITAKTTDRRSKR
jgi:hypothetical protein